MDDVEDGIGECAVRGREGGSHLRPKANVKGRTGTADAAVRERDSAADRAGPGYSGAGRLYGCADYGVDHGHLLDDARPYGAGRGDGQADLGGRFAGPGRSDGPRLGVRGGRGL